MGTLDGKVAFITGSAMGNGEGIARCMAEKGATVILADINDKVFETAKSIGDCAYPVKVDITDYDAVKKAADEVIAKFGHVDILVNNAGVARFVDCKNMDDKIRDFHINVNIIGPWNCTKAFINHMIDRKYGRIVNLSSTTGPMVSDPGMMAYAMTKGAVLAFTKATAMDLAKYGITANAILPGYILTPMVRHSAEETNPADPQSVIDGIGAGIPMGHLGDPKDIGYAAAFLASDEAGYITGTSILVDGALTLPETNAMGNDKV